MSEYKTAFERRVLQMMPANGWFVRFNEEDGPFDIPLVAWALADVIERVDKGYGPLIEMGAYQCIYGVLPAGPGDYIDTDYDPAHQDNFGGYHQGQPWWTEDEGEKST